MEKKATPNKKPEGKMDNCEAKKAKPESAERGCCNKKSK